MKHVYYLIALLLSVQMTIAQGTVTGNVTDDQGVPLPGAQLLKSEQAMVLPLILMEIILLLLVMMHHWL